MRLPSKRVTGLDAYRHLLAIFVITIHTWSASRYGPDLREGYDNILQVTGCAVFGFFLVSGFLFKPEASLKEIAARKASRLLVPYLLFSLAYAVVSGVVFGSGEFLNRIINTVLLRGGAMQLYFLPELYVIELLALFAFKLFGSRTSVAASTILIVALFATLATPTPYTTGPGWKLAIFYVVGFVTGVLCRRTSDATPAILLVLFLLVGALVDYRFAVAAVALVLFQLFIRTTRLVPTSLPGSGAVYLLHTPILNFSISVALSNFGFQGWSNYWMTVLLTYLVCIAVFAALSRYAPSTQKYLLE